MSRYSGIDPVSPDRSDSWSVSIEGDETQHLRSKHTDVEEDEWDDVVSTAVSILGRCPRPDAEAEAHRTGLALGKIQSGKTLSYTALTALAIDNHYRITVVLAGTKNPLLEQIYTRLYDDLVDTR